MKKLLLLLILTITPVFAQEQTKDQRTIQLLSQDIGAMHGQIAALVAQLEEANRKIQSLTQPKVEEKK